MMQAKSFDLLFRLKSVAVSGFRGKPRVDIAALVAAAAGIGDLFLATPDIDEFKLKSRHREVRWAGPAHRRRACRQDTDERRRRRDQ